MYGWLIKIGIVAALLAGFGFWCWTGGAASVKKDFDAAKAEWKAIEPLVQKVNDLRREQIGGMGRGMMGGRNRGGDQAAQGCVVHDRLSAPFPYGKPRAPQAPASL